MSDPAIQRTGRPEETAASGGERTLAGHDSYASTVSAREIGQILRGAARPLLLSHAKPDGDAVGSLLSMRHLLSAIGAEPTIVLMGPVEPALLEVAAATPMRRLERDGLPETEPDLVVVVDTGAWPQLEPMGEWLRARRDRVVGIDHHARGDDVAPRRVVDARCASTTQVIVTVIDAMEVAISPPMAEALFMGLATDTGWFRFSSADDRVFALAARLLAAGADKDRLYAILEQSLRPAQLALQARALVSMELLCDGRAALMRLAPGDFRDTGASPEDTGGIVNDPLALRSVRVSTLLTESEPGRTRISFRSKPPIAAGPSGPGEPGGADDGDESQSIDVNELASRIGGGGHRHAAGARLEMPIDRAAEEIRRLLAGAL